MTLLLLGILAFMLCKDALLPSNRGTSRDKFKRR